MKMICLMLMMAVLLCGCQATTTFETLEDVYYDQAENAPKQIAVSLPQGTTLIRNGDSRLYLCNGYDITVEVLATIQLLCHIPRLVSAAVLVTVRMLTLHLTPHTLNKVGL